MRVELVIGRLLRSTANDSIKPAQFSIRRELHKECFDKFVGVIDLKRCEVDRLAFARGL